MPARGKATGGFSIEIDGEEQVRVAVGRMQHAFEDLRPVWDAFREAFYAAELAQFSSEGSAGRGGAWPGLSKDYAAWKAQHYPGMPLMVRTNALRGSLMGGDGHVYEPHPTWMGIGTGVEYAIHHQRGAGDLPVRKLIDISAVQESAGFGRALGETARNMGKMWSGSGMKPFALS